MKNIKKAGAIITVVLLMIFGNFFFVNVRAAERICRLYDFDNSISDSKESVLNDKIIEVSQKESINIAVVFTNDAEGKSSMEYADDFYDDLFGVNTDGILMLVDHDNSNVWISTSGSVIGSYDERTTDLLSTSLKKGKNEEAVEKFLEYISPGKLSKALKVSSMKKAAGWGFLISLVVSLITCGIIKGSYSVNQQVTARNYVSGNGVRLFVKQDQFLRTSTTKSVRESDSGRGGGGGGSIHISSSGGTHGGSGSRI